MALEFDISWCGMFMSPSFTVWQNYQADYQTQFELSAIPPLDRRRLGRASKAIFSLLSPNLQDGLRDCPIVFSSKVGEINRCFSLLENLASGNGISPTAFSLSVLNATPATLAIREKNYTEITALSSKDFLEVGICNAALKLSEYSKVLVIVFSEGVAQKYYSPTFYEQENPQEVPFWCFCAIVCRGNTFLLEYAEDSCKIDELKNLTNALELVKIKRSKSSALWDNNAWKWEYRAKND